MKSFSYLAIILKNPLFCDIPVLHVSLVFLFYFPDAFRVFFEIQSLHAGNCFLQAPAWACLIGRFLTKTTLFTGLAAKIHCQSGLAQSTAGFYPTSAETSHSEHLPEVTVPCYSQRNLGKKKRCWKRSACRPPRFWAAGIIGINDKECNRNLTRLLTAGHEWRLNGLLSC